MDIEKLIRENIDKTIHMSLATTSGNKPWVSEVHFAYDPQLNLYFRSLKTRRHSLEIAENPNVAGNIVDKYLKGEPVVGLYFEGKAQILEAEEERRSIFPYLHDRLGADESILDDARQAEGHQFYIVRVTQWYLFGKFNDQPSQKYQLPWYGRADTPAVEK